MITPFKKLEMHEFYRHDLEKILMASRLASAIKRDEKDTRACGDEVEIAVREFFKSKLQPKYHVSDGHIIDKELNVSQQIDIIISDAMKNPVFDAHANGSELVFYDSVYAYGEVKKSYYQPDILQKTSENLKCFKQTMKRETIGANVLECSNDLLRLKQTTVDNPQRNILLVFLFVVDSMGVDLNKIREELGSTFNSELPNMIVFLDTGIYLNVKKSSLKAGQRPVINLYPKDDDTDQEWRLLTFDNPSGVLNYAHLLLQEHLRATIVKAPDFLEYSDYIFKVYHSSFV